jgi:hypothetical protein
MRCPESSLLKLSPIGTTTTRIYSKIDDSRKISTLLNSVYSKIRNQLKVSPSSVILLNLVIIKTLESTTSSPKLRLSKD